MGRSRAVFSGSKSGIDGLITRDGSSPFTSEGRYKILGISWSHEPACFHSSSIIPTAQQFPAFRVYRRERGNSHVQLWVESLQHSRQSHPFELEAQIA
jgi:hypothetical protein